MSGRAPPNPFYANSNPPQPAQSSFGSPPPAYNQRPVPLPPSGPVSYGSLSDLTKGKQPKPSTNTSGFSYTPDATRQGYRASGHEPPSSSPGLGRDDTSGSVGAGGRRMPPAPGYHGSDRTPVPPTRNVAPVERTATPPTQTSRFASYQQQAAGYVPNSVSATASSLAGRARDGFDGIATQQRREQVVAGAGKAAAGAAKLAGKAAWSLGKFASGSK